MAVTNVLYAKFPANAMGGEASGDGPLDLLSDALKATLHTATYSPNQQTNETKSDATNELGTGGGYTAGGLTLGTKAVTVTTLTTAFDAADLLWTAFTNTFRYLVLWDDTGATPADPLICLIDTGGTQTLSGTDLAFTFNASGIFTITVA